MKRCFVISPIGPPDSPTRKHADYVFKYIIQPAMKECDFEAWRSDHLKKPGRISEEMFNALLREDMCIAVLTEYNPNVFYELAIAQCAQRPVIILMQKGNLLPFDIADLRCVYYDFDLDSLWEQRTYVNEIVAHVKSMQSADWKVPSLFGRLELGGEAAQAGQVRFFRRSMDFGNAEVWLEALRETKAVFELMGISMAVWKRGKEFARLLAEKAEAGCKVRILLMHPDNPALREMINVALDHDVRSVMRATNEMFQYFISIAPSHANVQVRRLRHGCPHVQLTRTDQRALAIQYMFSESTGYSPLCEYEEGSLLYNTMTQEFESLWKANDPKGRNGAMTKGRKSSATVK